MSMYLQDKLMAKCISLITLKPLKIMGYVLKRFNDSDRIGKYCLIGTGTMIRVGINVYYYTYVGIVSVEVKDVNMAILLMSNPAKNKG